MSRSSRTSAGSSSMSASNSAPSDKDIVMGPPPLPPQIAVSAPVADSSKGREKETAELAEKYRRLKRKYFELEEKHKDVTTELRGSGERAVKLRTERAYLLERITELETLVQQNTHVYAGYQQPLNSAYPRSLATSSSQKRFFGNLDRAMSEAENEDHNVDPLLQSKHVGPSARKRMEAEQKERLEEEQREQKKNTRQTRKRNVKEKEKEKEIPLAASSNAKHAGLSGERASTRTSERERERAEKEPEAVDKAVERADGMDSEREETGPPLTLAPAPSSHRDLEMHDADSPPPSQTPVLLSTNGQRLRIKPPTQPSSSPQPRYAPPSSPSHLPPPPSPPQQDRHNQIPHRHEYDNNVRRSPVANRFDPREDQYQPTERDDMNIDRDSERSLVSSQQNDPPPQFTHPPPLPPVAAVISPQLQGPGQSIHSPSPDFSMSSRSSPDIRAALPVPAGPSAPLPVAPAPVVSMPAAAIPRSASASSRNGRKRSDSPAVFTPGSEDSGAGAVMAKGAVASSAQAAMMGQLVLSPPSPYRLTPVDPPPLKPAMQMTFRTSPATHMSQYGHPGGGPPGSNGNGGHLQQQSGSPVAEPQPYRSGGITSPGGPGEHTISFGNGMEVVSSMSMGGSGSVSGSGSSGGGGGIALGLLGPAPAPVLLQTPLNTPVPTAGAGGSRGKPKRLKAHTVTSKSYSIPMVPRDKAGKPMLPLNVGIMTVLNLGEVCMREHFHTERYIFPVGYEVTRKYLSTIDPATEAVYNCTILDGGDGPKFQIIASDSPEKPVIAGTATGAWAIIVRAANMVRSRQHSNSVSGPDFFGLGQNTIKHLIQELSGAERLQNYVWQNFVEGGPLGGRHAAVIPALPEEHDAPEHESHYPGGTMGMIAMTPVPASPQPSFFASGNTEDSKGALQIIQMDSPAGNGSTQQSTSASSPLATMTDRASSVKPITFQQEFPQRYNKDHRSRDELGRDGPAESGRRGSIASSYTNEDYEHTRSRGSLPSPSRHATHSPVMQREPYSPHSQRSPYQTPPTPHQSSPPVPAGLASIMHAYSAPPMSGPGVPEGYQYENAGAPRKRRGSHADSAA